MRIAHLHKETVELLRECALLAEDLHGFGLKEALLVEGLIGDIRDAARARLVFDHLLGAVDWANPEAARPFLHIFEAAYAESPISYHSLHGRIDRALERDGLKFEDGCIQALDEDDAESAEDRLQEGKKERPCKAEAFQQFMCVSSVKAI